MKTRISSLVVAIFSSSVIHANDSARLDRMEQDISELGFLVRKLSAKFDKISTDSPAQAIRNSNRSLGGSHLVRTGETYWGIARKYGLSVNALCKANPGVSAKRLPIGKRINLPGSSSGFVSHAPSPNQDRLSSYTVKKGDTLSHIALRHGITLKQLLANNSGINPRKMQIGHELFIPSTRKSPPAPPIESAPPSRGNEELPPLPELPPTLPDEIPAPEVPPLSVEEGTPPPNLTEESKSEEKALDREPNLVDPEESDLVVIDENSRLAEIANRYLTDVATLNRLNNVDLAPEQMIKSGSQLYIPRD